MGEVREGVGNWPSYIPVNCFPQDSLKYAILSGPDGLADYRSHQLVDRRPLGSNPYTSEATWDAEYLWRAPPQRALPQITPRGPGPGTPIPADRPCLPPVHMRPRSSFGGEIGWHHLVLGTCTPESLWTGHQILMGEFRQKLEDRFTHRYQSTWYPSENEWAAPVRDGAYFERFPNTGKNRPCTSHEFRADNNNRNAARCHSAGSMPSMSSSSSSSSRYQAWRRTPAATPISPHGHDDDDGGGGGGGEVVGEEERDEEGCEESGLQAGARSSKQLLRTSSQKLPRHSSPNINRGSQQRLHPRSSQHVQRGASGNLRHSSPQSMHRSSPMHQGNIKK